MAQFFNKCGVLSDDLWLFIYVIIKLCVDGAGIGSICTRLLYMKHRYEVSGGTHTKR